jgi:malate dehydrogenase
MGTGGALMSAAKSIVDHLRDWFIAKNKKISMGVIISKSIYGLPKDICFSMPVVCLGDGNYRIIDNLHLNEYQQTRVSEGKQ